MPFHSGLRTESKDSIPYGVAASANAAIARALMVLTFCCSSTRPGVAQTHKKTFRIQFREGEKSYQS